MASQSQIEDLANYIGSNVGKLSEHFRANHLSFPSFDINGPIDLGIQSKDVEHARHAAISQCMELLDLLQGPQMCVRPCFNATSLHAIYKFDLAAKVPLTRSISFSDLARASELYEPDLRRILRFAMIYHRCFCEPVPGFVAHTAASKQLVTNPDLRDGIGLMFDDFYPSFARTIDALETFGDQQPNHTGWALAHNSTDKNLFEYLATQPARAARFGGAMKFFSSTVPGNDPRLLLTNYPWASLGAATVVDVGGSTGYISAMLADACPDLRFVVQDLPSTVAQVSAQNAHPRITFQGQDFFEPNQEVGADVYLFRWVLHDWPDAQVVKILQALVPALKRGARVVVNDNVGPGQAGKMPHYGERFVREIDMIMLSAFNSYEREREDWKRVFTDADARFGEAKITNVEGSLLGLIEAVWEE